MVERNQKISCSLVCIGCVTYTFLSFLKNNIYNFICNKKIFISEDEFSDHWNRQQMYFPLIGILFMVDSGPFSFIGTFGVQAFLAWSSLVINYKLFYSKHFHVGVTGENLFASQLSSQVTI